LLLDAVMVVLDPIQSVLLVAFRLMLLADVILAVTAVRGLVAQAFLNFQR
jgi:hypothetical protein